MTYTKDEIYDIVWNISENGDMGCLKVLASVFKEEEHLYSIEDRKDIRAYINIASKIHTGREFV